LTYKILNNRNQHLKKKHYSFLSSRGFKSGYGIKKCSPLAVVFAVLGAANVVCDLAAKVAEVATLLVTEIAGSPALQQICIHFGTATNLHSNFGTATRLHTLWHCNNTAYTLALQL
jgi:hypothetical protein